MFATKAKVEAVACGAEEVRADLGQRAVPWGQERASTVAKRRGGVCGDEGKYFGLVEEG